MSMKISKPISLMAPSHKDEGGGFWPDEYFYDDLRREIKGMVRLGIPVSMRGGKLLYNNKVEGVRFQSIIEDLGQINQWRSNWVTDAFLAQIGVERLLHALSGHDVEELLQQGRGDVTWRWLTRSFTGSCNPKSHLWLRISDGENCRDDQFHLTGALTPRFVLENMQKIEKALTVQIKLMIYLQGKDVEVKALPNHLVAAHSVIRIPLEGRLQYKSDGQEYDAVTTRIHGYVAEFESPPAAPVAPIESEIITNLNLE
jgi:hypothetical protein